MTEFTNQWYAEQGIDEQPGYVSLGQTKHLTPRPKVIIHDSRTRIFVGEGGETRDNLMAALDQHFWTDKHPTRRGFFVEVKQGGDAAIEVSSVDKEKVESFVNDWVFENTNAVIGDFSVDYVVDSRSGRPTINIETGNPKCFFVDNEKWNATSQGTRKLFEPIRDLVSRKFFPRLQTNTHTHSLRWTFSSTRNSYSDLDEEEISTAVQDWISDHLDGDRNPVISQVNVITESKSFGAVVNIFCRYPGTVLGDKAQRIRKLQDYVNENFLDNFDREIDFGFYVNVQDTWKKGLRIEEGVLPPGTGPDKEGVVQFCEEWWGDETRELDLTGFEYHFIWEMRWTRPTLWIVPNPEQDSPFEYSTDEWYQFVRELQEKYDMDISVKLKDTSEEE